MSVVESSGSGIQAKHSTTTFALLLTLLFLVVAVVILTSLLIANLKEVQNTITAAANRTVHYGIWKVFDTDLLCSKLFDNCQSPNGSTPYARLLWPFLGDRLATLSNESTSQQAAHVVGAHSMAFTDAILVLGQIPIDRVYWALTVYLYDIPSTSPESVDGRLTLAASVSDSISAANTVAEVNGQYLGLIITPNPNMVPVVQQQFNQTLGFGGSIDSIQWKTIFIPTSMYDPTYRYCVFTRILQTACNSTINSYNTWWFTDSNVLLPSGDVPPTWKTRNTLPNEVQQYFPTDDGQGSLAAYYDYGRSILATDFKDVLDQVDMQYVEQTVPYLSWIPGFCDSPERCGLICGSQGLEFKTNLRYCNTDTIYFVCRNIEVKKGQDLVFLAVNHVCTNAVVRYSNLTLANQKTEVSWLGILTGLHDPPSSILDPPPQVLPFNKLVQKIPDTVFGDSDTGTIYITERAYVTSSGIGPYYSSILPVQVYLVPSGTAPSPPYSPQASQFAQF